MIWWCTAKYAAMSNAPWPPPTLDERYQQHGSETIARLNRQPSPASCLPMLRMAGASPSETAARGTARCCGRVTTAGNGKRSMSTSEHASTGEPLLQRRRHQIGLIALSLCLTLGLLLAACPLSVVAIQQRVLVPPRFSVRVGGVEFAAPCPRVASSAITRCPGMRSGAAMTSRMDRSPTGSCTLSTSSRPGAASTSTARRKSVIGSADDGRCHYRRSSIVYRPSSRPESDFCR
jgi:hypothetical protein